MGARLETALARRPGQDADNISIATLAALTGDIGESVKRVEAALIDHDGALISLIGSMSRVQAAAVDMHAIRSESVVPAADGETSLGAALSHLDGVADQAEQLLQQSEALAEAVMAGRAPALSSLLADRAPVLLARVETATRRLRSAATALAIASDGQADAYYAGRCRNEDLSRSFSAVAARFLRVIPGWRAARDIAAACVAPNGISDRGTHCRIYRKPLDSFTNP
jgi:hypothetical protein